MTRANHDRRSRLLLGALVVSHLLLISRQVDTGGNVSLLERTAFSALHPFQLVVARGAQAAVAGWRSFVDLRGVRQENQRLKNERDALRLELQRYTIQAAEGAHLRNLLELRPLLPQPGIAAELVARGGLPWYRTFVVDRGLEAGVELNSPVVSPDGLVGRVIAVAAGASKVQALLDQHAGTSVLIERSRVTGVISGQIGNVDSSEPRLTLKYVPVRADVVVGDAVVTSGLDRVFPKGLRVGHVSQVQPGTGLFQEILVTPAAAFESLEVVLILPPTPAVPLAEEEPR